MEKITRRDFLKSASLIGMAGIIGFGSTSCIENGSSKNLFVYNWPFYISDNVIKGFEQEFKIKITYDNYSSNEELLAKLHAGASGYDLIFPSDYMVAIMINENLLEELDLTKITNFKNLDEKFKNLSFDPNNRYSIPYLWGTSGIGYNTEKVTDKVLSWQILWDEKYKDRISMLDDVRSIANPALKILGYSINTTDPGQIKEAKELLLKQKPLVKAYTSDTYVDFLKSGDVWLSEGYSGDVFQVIKEHKVIKYAIPEEGTELWVDNMCIPRGSKNKESAEMFIDFLLRPEISAEISNTTWYANPNSASYKFINPEITKDKSIYPPQEIMDKCELLKDLGEANKLYEALYNELKST
ncbi:MAG TPA: spermidine/putrescine ABC transporter substrate-binding protein [Candidatus Eremiobacteraeota bacterium]|nr:MAG: Spermidine/putrescine-binding periplasmic protein precursor [bacterium ADurb.Bin363]HPZ10455.1 spermidine/putrescine ABC transporter substrate-binding protein [Candidatus Eremiobacteraeota bacterium]